VFISAQPLSWRTRSSRLRNALLRVGEFHSCPCRPGGAVVFQFVFYVETGRSVRVSGELGPKIRDFIPRPEFERDQVIDLHDLRLGAGGDFVFRAGLLLHRFGGVRNCLVVVEQTCFVLVVRTAPGVSFGFGSCAVEVCGANARKATSKRILSAGGFCAGNSARSFCPMGDLISQAPAATPPTCKAASAKQARCNVATSRDSGRRNIS